MAYQLMHRSLLAILSATLLWANLAVGAAPPAGNAAKEQSARANWLIKEIYQSNHPYATQASEELADKMRKMAQSPYNFLRGTNHVFFNDIRRLPSLASGKRNGTDRTWLCGDAHLGNLAAARDAGGNTVFALSDFDDSYLGSYLWDLQRMGVSIVLAARENGLPEASIAGLLNSFAEAYFAQMAEFADGSADKDLRLVQESTSGAVQSTLKQAAKKQREKWLAKYTSEGKSPRKFEDKPDLRPIKAGTLSAISAALPAYIASLSAPKRYPSGFFYVKDVRQKLASGTGSLGRLRYWLLIEGESNANDDDMIIEMKQSATSSVAIAAPERLPVASYAGNEAQRVVMSLRAQNPAPDPLAGFTHIEQTPYFLREKSPFTEDFDFGQLSTTEKFLEAMPYVAQALASAHALADQNGSLSVLPRNLEQLITADNNKTKNPSLSQAITRFALSYAQLVESDWQTYKAALAAGTALY